VEPVIKERYQLYHGDCLELMKTIPDGSIDMICCDLPYGKLVCHWDKVIPFDKLWEQYGRIIKERGAIVLFGSQPFTSTMVASKLKWYRHCWVWNKVNGCSPFGRKYSPSKTHEDIIVFGSRCPKYYPVMKHGKLHCKARTGKRRSNAYGEFIIGKDVREIFTNEYHPISILTYVKQLSRHNNRHPSEKPVQLLQYLIRTYSQEGETVLDNCFGSCSCGVAAITTDRKFIGIEKDEEYFAMGVERMRKESAVVNFSEN
jgi:site-specific DNA-methyltransferase (adenine-specific)